MNQEVEHRMQYRVYVWMMAGIVLMSVFVMLVWLVQQSKMQTNMLVALSVQQQALVQSVKVKRKPVKAVQTLATPNPSTDVGTQAAPPSTAQGLLRQAFIRAQKLRKLAKSGAYQEAGKLIAPLKKEIWKASLKLPNKQKVALQKLMGVLDYTAGQLRKGKTGDTKTPLQTMKRVLDETDG